MMKPSAFNNCRLSKLESRFPTETGGEGLLSLLITFHRDGSQVPEKEISVLKLGKGWEQIYVSKGQRKNL